MGFKNETEVIELIKDNLEVKTWMANAREHSKVLRALVLGENYSDLLIEGIEKIESTPRKEARKKYSKDIRDMFHRVHEARDNVFSASGGGLHIDISSETFKDDFLMHLKEFKGNKSLRQFLSEYYFSLVDTDPNGLIMLEYLKQEDIFPTYKSTDDIRNYLSDGQKLEWVIFEPVQKQLENKTEVLHWRVVDDETDWMIIQVSNTFILDKAQTFKHPFGDVPAVVLSGVNKLGTETRFSPLFPIEELGKDYARDKSVLTVYKFLHGFPKEWRYVQQCVTCRGVGKTGEETCKECSGTGKMGKGDVTDIQELPMPRQDDPTITPDVSGFNSPDLETWKQYNEDLLTAEQKMHNTVWGTDRVKPSDRNDETATARYIDVQPVMNKLDKLSNGVQWIDNTLATWTLRWVENNANTTSTYHISYGRGFIIESPEALLIRYEKARVDESSFTVLNRLLGEYLLSKYQNNPVLLEEMRKEALVEPYLHMLMTNISLIFGREEALRKQLFGDFWEEADKDKEVNVLKKDFDTYFTTNKQKFKAPEVVLPPPAN